jgi:signal transduction histidine kinase
MYRKFQNYFCTKEYNEKKGKEECTENFRNPECGSFSFNFYIFDFGKNPPAKYELDEKDKIRIKDHRIYLYRDGIRVFPYGNPDDDWLQIDKLRGTERASFFFSNDQVVGWIGISKKENPKLKDKTNREGLIEEGNATQDFIALIQSFLSFFRLHQFKQYLKDYQKNKKEQDIFKTEEIFRQFEEIKNNFKDNKAVLNAVNNLYNTYSLERNYLVRRVEATEDLASVGLSVETASHDMMMMLSKGIEGIDNLMKDCMTGSISVEDVGENLQKLRGIFSFVETQMKDLQGMFRSTKQRRRNIRVDDILQKVVRIYKNVLTRSKIKLEIKKTGSPLIAKCTDAVLLQLFINLFDNSIYWLTDINIKNRKIFIQQDGNKGKLIFADNGLGINKDDEPYIFEPFYSAKEEGRGLGLYIAKQLLERIDYAIWLADIKSEKILAGANFVVSFVKNEDQ